MVFPLFLMYETTIRKDLKLELRNYHTDLIVR